MTILKKDVQKFYMALSDAANAGESHGDMAYFHDANPPGWFICQDHSGGIIPTAGDDTVQGRENDIWWHRQTVIADSIGNGGIVPKDYVAGTQVLAQELVVIGGTIFVSTSTHVVTADNVTNRDQINPVSTSTKIIPQEYVTGLVLEEDELVIVSGALYTVDSAHTATALNVDNLELVTAVSSTSTQVVINGFVANHVYADHEMIIESSALYRRDGAGTSAASFALDIANWDIISSPNAEVLVPDWAINTAYKETEMVTVDERLFRRLTDGTSTGSWGTDAANWEEIASVEETLIGDFVPNKVYSATQVIVESNRFYRRILAGAAGADFASDAGNWVEISGANTDVVISNWTLNKVYALNETIVEAGRIYRRNTAGQALTDFATDASNWTEVSAASAGITAWAALTTYGDNELVIQNERLYRRQAAAPDDSLATWALDESNWDEISPQNHNPIPDYQANTDYLGGQCVARQGIILRRDANGNSGPAFTEGDWTVLSPEHVPSIPDWESNKFYQQNEFVTEGGKLYRKTAAGNSLGTWVLDSGNWEEISPSADPMITDFAATTTYSANEVVVESGRLYRRNTAGTSGGSFDAAEQLEWTEISPAALTLIPDFVANTVYADLQPVMVGDRLYRRIGDGTSAVDFATDAANWMEVSPAIPQLLNDFVANNDYVANDFITEGGRLYRRNTDGTSAADFATDAVEWTEISPTEDAQIVDFAATTLYEANEMVIESDRLYRRIAQGTSGAAFDAAEQLLWTEISPALDQVVLDFAGNTDYVANELVVESGRLYRRNTDGTSGADFATDVAEWTEISEPQDITLADWAANTDYVENELTIESDRLYRRITAGNSGADFATDGANWDEISVQAKIIVNDWTPNTDYETNEVVTDFNNRMYRRIAAGTSRGTFDPAERVLWEELSTLSLRDFAANTIYSNREMISQNGRLYRRNGAGTSGADWSTDEANWTEISPAADMIIGDWTGATDYEDQEMIIHEGRLLRRDGQGTSEATFDATEEANWTVVHADRSRIRELEAGIDVSANEVVFLDDSTYRASVDVVGVDLSDLSDFEVIATRQQIRGQYATTTAYRQNEMMFLGTDLYVVLRDYTSDTPANDIANSDIRQLNPDQHIGYRGEYATGEDYLTEDLFFNGDILYRVLGDYTSVNIGDDLTNNDITIVSSDAIVIAGEYQAAGTVYTAGQLVFNSNRIYHVQQQFTSVDWATDNIPANLVELSPPANPSAPDWAASTDYEKDSLVIQGETIYRRNTTGTSGAVFDSSEWTALKAQASAIVADFLDSVSYAEDELVFESGILYRANAAVASGNPFDALEWSRVAENKIVIEGFKATTVYADREAIQHEGKIYLADGSFTSLAAFDANDWIEAIPPVTVINDWAANTAYELNQCILWGDQIYRRRTAGTSNATWDLVEAGEWEEISPQDDDVNIPEWATGNRYNEGETVFHDGSIYRRHTTGDAEPTFDATEEAQWDNLSDRAYTLDLWVADTAYTAGELIAGANDELLRRNTDGTSGATFDVTEAAEWTEISAAADMIVGNWATGVVYGANEIIIQADRLYRRNDGGGTSAVDWATDATNWDEISEQAKILVPDFIGNHDYMTNELMISDDRIYRRDLTGTSRATFDVTEVNEWTEISPEADMIVLDWAANTLYEDNELIIEGDKLYRRIGRNTSAADWATDESNWDEISASVDIKVEAWASNTTYSQDNMVTVGTRLFQKIADGDSTGTFDAAEELLWNEIAPSSEVIVNDWVAATVYREGQLAVNDDKVYRRIVAGTSAADWATDAVNWEELSAANNIVVNDWAANTDYIANNMVTIGKRLFKRIADGTSGATFDNAEEALWTEIAPEQEIIAADFQANHEYVINELICQDDRLFRRTAAGESLATWALDSANWTPLSSGATIVGAYTATADYVAGEVVTHEGAILRCLNDVTNAPAAPAALDWETIAEVNNFIGAYTVGTVYKVGQSFTVEGSQYSVDTEFTATAVFDDTMLGNCTLVQIGPDTGLAADSTVTVTNSQPSGKGYIVEGDFTGTYLAIDLLEGDRLVLNKALAAGATVTDADVYHYRTHGNAIKRTELRNPDAITFTDNSIAGDYWDVMNNYAASYLGFDLVRGDRLVLNKDRTSGDAPADRDFELFRSATEIPPYSDTARYAVGDQVTYRGFVYTCNTTILLGEVFALAKWDRVIPAGFVHDSYVEDNVYLATDCIYNQYGAKFEFSANVTSGAWNTQSANLDTVHAAPLRAVGSNWSFEVGEAHAQGSTHLVIADYSLERFGRRFKAGDMIVLLADAYFGQPANADIQVIRADDSNLQPYATGLYGLGDTVTHNDMRWICVADSTLVFDTTDWARMPSAGATFHGWSDTAHYLAGDVVIVDGVKIDILTEKTPGTLAAAVASGTEVSIGDATVKRTLAADVLLDDTGVYAVGQEYTITEDYTVEIFGQTPKAGESFMIVGEKVLETPVDADVLWLGSAPVVDTVLVGIGVMTFGGSPGPRLIANGTNVVSTANVQCTWDVDAVQMKEIVKVTVNGLDVTDEFDINTGTMLQINAASTFQIFGGDRIVLHFVET